MVYPISDRAIKGFVERHLHRRTSYIYESNKVVISELGLCFSNEGVPFIHATRVQYQGMQCRVTREYNFSLLICRYAPAWGGV